MKPNRENSQPRVPPTFISVIVPVYNKERHIMRALSSVAAQTFRSLEIVIVCDPSSDTSTEIAKAFKSLHDDLDITIHERSKPGPGGYAARNLGVTVAKHPWIAFLDADDVWDEEKLERDVEAIHRNPDHKIISSGWYISNGRTKKKDSFTKRSGHVYKSISFPEYLNLEITGRRPIFTCTLTIQKRIIENERFPEGQISMGGDVETWVRCVARCGKMLHHNHNNVTYFTNSDNMVTKSSHIDPAYHLKVADHLARHHPPEANLIYKRMNGLIVYAWKHNRRTGSGPNFSLLRNVNVKFMKLRWWFWIFVDLINSRSIFG